MKTQKMSLANIQGKLSRAEMKKIMAGSAACAVKCKDGQHFELATCYYAPTACATHGGEDNCDC